MRSLLALRWGYGSSSTDNGTATRAKPSFPIVRCHLARRAFASPAFAEGNRRASAISA